MNAKTHKVSIREHRSPQKQETTQQKLQKYTS